MTWHEFAIDTQLLRGLVEAVAVLGAALLLVWGMRRR